MTTVSSLKPVFVEEIPSDLAEGSLYISIRYGTAVHRCCCGCGNEVVTPFSPTDWRLIYDGQTVSLEPSIGNWSFPCQSHYWIRRSCVSWAPQWSRQEIEAGRTHDGAAKAHYYDQIGSPAKVEQGAETDESWWRRILVKLWRRMEP